MTIDVYLGKPTDIVSSRFVSQIGSSASQTQMIAHQYIREEESLIAGALARLDMEAVATERFIIGEGGRNNRQGNICRVDEIDK